MRNSVCHRIRNASTSRPDRRRRQIPDPKNTPEELIHDHKQGTFARGTKVVEVKRAKQAVEADLSQYVSRCIDGTVLHSQGNYCMKMSSSKTKYTAKLRASEQGKSILWIQTKTLGQLLA